MRKNSSEHLKHTPQHYKIKTSPSNGKLFVIQNKTKHYHSPYGFVTDPDKAYHFITIPAAREHLIHIGE